MVAGPRPGSGLVLTADVIAPLVDDPEAFGAIAACNALSDVYAMGGEPRFALNLAFFPDDKLPLDVLVAIQRGAARVCRAAAGGVRPAVREARDAVQRRGDLRRDGGRRRRAPHLRRGDRGVRERRHADHRGVGSGRSGRLHVADAHPIAIGCAASSGVAARSRPMITAGTPSVAPGSAGVAVVGTF